MSKEKIEKQKIDFKEFLNRGNQFLAIEGVDCSGKGQITKLIEKNGIRGVQVKRVDFPQYDLPSGKLIESYLNGDLGNYIGYFKEPIAGVETASEWHAVMSGRFEHAITEIDFVAGLYSLNRIEWFKRNRIDPDTIYVFDRFSYSNAIHHLGNLVNWMSREDGAADLMRIWWRESPDRKEVPFENWKLQRIYNACTTLYEKWLSYEYTQGVPSVYTFLLSIDEMHVMERINARKETKHEGRDILETQYGIHNACDFVNLSLYAQLHQDLTAAAIVPVEEFKQNNQDIADYISAVYSSAVVNDVDTEDLGDFVAAVEDDDEDLEEDE